MEENSPASREELYHVQMDVKHVQTVQINHADRLLRLEKRQADDAALKSVWNSPFPSVLGGTPQQGPVHTTSAAVFDDFDDEQSQNLLGSLHIDADEEPVRRGASRANSVRFDVSAIQGSSWAQGSRSSGEFAPTRPSSGIGSHPMIERSLSYKSDGRYSSAGHSVHSAPSGRTSSLGLDTNFMIGGQNDDLTMEVPEPPPGLFVLGTVPSIIRCWLNHNFSHSALLYAVVSTGSQKSQLDYSLVKELGLQDHMQDSGNDSYSIRLPVYLPEAIVTKSSSRTNSPAPRLPTLTASFDVFNIGQSSFLEGDKMIRVFLGSDTLRAHSADLFLSRNLMTLFGDDKNKVSVPFVRPEDDGLFRNLCTISLTPEKVELNVSAPAFTPIEHQVKDDRAFEQILSTTVRSNTSNEIQLNGAIVIPNTETPENQHDEPQSMTQGSLDGNITSVKHAAFSSEHLRAQFDDDHLDKSQHGRPHNDSHSSDIPSPDPDHRESSIGIWGSWRAGAVSSNDTDASRDGTSGGYQRTGRGARGMKVLKPSKVSQPARSTSDARTGFAYEAPPHGILGETRRKSQTGAEPHTGPRWESKRAISNEKMAHKDHLRPTTSTSKSSNPIGGASAFAWMNPGKHMGTQATAE